MSPGFGPEYRPALLRLPGIYPTASGYGTITLYRRTFQSTSPQLSATTPDLQPHICKRLPARIRFGLYCFRSPLITASLLISFPADTKMFQFSAFSFLSEWTISRSPVKSHSGIPGSTVACTYPGLIAACHALRRLY
jgi:hypothetical protein